MLKRSLIAVAFVLIVLAISFALRTDHSVHPPEIEGASDDVAHAPENVHSGGNETLSPWQPVQTPCINSSSNSAPLISDEALRQLDDSFQAIRQSIPATLAASSESGHLHAAALLEQNPANQLGYLKQGMLISPHDPLLVADALRICTAADKELDCPSTAWEAHLIAADGQNSQTWMRIAVNRHRAGDPAGALEALRFAATAAETRDHWPYQIELIEAGITASSDFSFPESAMLAIQFAAQNPPEYNDVIQMCQAESTGSSEWAYQCLTYGKLIEVQGKTAMGIINGIYLQHIAYVGLGDLSLASAAKARMRIRSQQWQHLFGEENVAAIQDHMFSSPQVFSTYLESIRNEGEYAAQMYLFKDWHTSNPDRIDAGCEVQPGGERSQM